MKNSWRDVKAWGMFNISTEPSYLELFNYKYVIGNCESFVFKGNGGP